MLCHAALCSIRFISEGGLILWQSSVFWEVWMLTTCSRFPAFMVMTSSAEECFYLRAAKDGADSLKKKKKKKIPPWAERSLFLQLYFCRSIQQTLLPSSPSLPRLLPLIPPPLFFCFVFVFVFNSQPGKCHSFISFHLFLQRKTPPSPPSMLASGRGSPFAPSSHTKEPPRRVSPVAMLCNKA